MFTYICLTQSSQKKHSLLKGACEVLLYRNMTTCVRRANMSWIVNNVKTSMISWHILCSWLKPAPKRPGVLLYIWMYFNMHIICCAGFLQHQHICIHTGHPHMLVFSATGFQFYPSWAGILLWSYYIRTQASDGGKKQIALHKNT